MYIVAAPSKSGTTSFFKLLTDNNKLPALQTHDLWHFNVHDRPDGEFTLYMQKNHPGCMSPPKGYDYDVQNMGVVSYHVVLKNDMKDDFFRHVKRRAKVLRTGRDPYSRAVSAFLHWCQYRQVLNELGVEEMPPGDPLAFLLGADTGNMSFDLMLKMVDRIKKKKALLDIQDLAELFEYHFFVPGRLLAEYRFLDHMLENHLHKPRSYKHVDIGSYSPKEVLRFLGIPVSTAVPRERDRRSCTQYVFGMPVDEVFDYLLELVKYMDLPEDDTRYIGERWPTTSSS